MKKRLLHWAMVLPLLFASTGFICFGAFKGSSSSSVGGTFGGFFGIGILVGATAQWFDYISGESYSSRVASGSIEIGERVADPLVLSGNEASGTGYLSEQGLTAIVVRDETHNVTVEVGVPADGTGTYRLGNSNGDMPWVAVDVDGDRYTSADGSEVIVTLKRYPDVGGQMVGAVDGKLAAADGSLHQFRATFSATRVM